MKSESKQNTIVEIRYTNLHKVTPVNELLDLHSNLGLGVGMWNNDWKTSVFLELPAEFLIVI